MSQVEFTRPAQQVSVQIEKTQPRRTPPPAGRQFRDSLGAGAGAVLEGVESAAGFVPGGSVVSAAVRHARQPGEGTPPEAPGTQAGSGGGGNLQQALASHTEQSMRYLELQQRISSESRRFSALSNVMKARHDTTKTAINNIR
jgi:hypothetical protein